MYTGTCLHCGCEGQFELEGDDDICPECGWEKNAADKTKIVKKRSGVLTFLGLYHILGGIFALMLSILVTSALFEIFFRSGFILGLFLRGIIVIFVGISILKQREKSRKYGVAT